MDVLFASFGKVGQGVVSLLVLGVLIFVHELGHFLVAKMNRVGVLEFAIGFGKKLWSKRRGETRYSIGIIPLGGYVRMVGDDPRIMKASEALEAADTALGEHSPVDAEELALIQDKSKWFLNKSYLSKCAIVIAGPGFNIIFAFLLAVFSYSVYGKHVPVSEAVLGDVFPGYPAANSGLKANDRIISIDGTPIKSWEELAKTVAGSGGKEMTFKVERSDDTSRLVQELKVTGTQEASELAILDGSNAAKQGYKIGIFPSMAREPVGFGEAITASAEKVYALSVLTIRSFWLMIKGLISPKHISGPITIMQEAARSAGRGIEDVLGFMILLSVSLAVLNLLPIPILDGGHLVFFTLEALKGRPLSLRVQELANQVGMLLLLLLMVFALGNDVRRVLGLG